MYLVKEERSWEGLVLLYHYHYYAVIVRRLFMTGFTNSETF